MIARQAHANGGCGSESSPSAPSALDLAFREHHRAVFRAAFRVIGSVADAEDVLQTVFLNVLGRSRRGEDPTGRLGDQPERFLVRAAINAAIDVLRSRKPAVDWDAEAVVEPVAAADHEDEIWRRELRARLRSALAQLAPRSAEMVALRYFEGYGNVEIAAVLNTTASTVAVTLHRARQSLKAHLGGLEHEQQD